jgi:hypothetical protein
LHDARIGSGHDGDGVSDGNANANGSGRNAIDDSTGDSATVAAAEQHAHRRAARFEQLIDKELARRARATHARVESPPAPRSI